MQKKCDWHSCKGSSSASLHPPTRLLKAACTFDNAIEYVAWKVERHSGYRIEPTPFQRRHPLLAAPRLYWRLRRLGVFR